MHVSIRQGVHRLMSRVFTLPTLSLMSLAPSLKDRELTPRRHDAACSNVSRDMKSASEWAQTTIRFQNDIKLMQAFTALLECTGDGKCFDGRCQKCRLALPRSVLNTSSPSKQELDPSLSQPPQTPQVQVHKVLDLSHEPSSPSSTTSLDSTSKP